MFRLIYDGRHVHHGRGACTRTRSACLLGIVIFPLGAAVPASEPADVLAPGASRLASHREQDRPPFATYSLKEAVAKVRREVPGRILAARTVREGGDDARPVHHIKVLTPRGRVVVIRIDGHTGKRLD